MGAVERGKKGTAGVIADGRDWVEREMQQKGGRRMAGGSQVR
jgi:hypothetical protein